MNGLPFFSLRRYGVALATAGWLAGPASHVAHGQGDLIHNVVFNAPGDVPLTFNGFTATGRTVNITLNFAPAVGTDLTVVNNTSLGFIRGTFANLDHGRAVSFSFGGVTYQFVANYFGGTGNDLVLQWAVNRVMAWGENLWGRLGTGEDADSLVPVPVNTSGALAGKVVVAVTAGADNSFALCSDGTLVFWGADNSMISRLPATVTPSGALSGRRVAAISAGGDRNVALCSDGTVAEWGWSPGQPVALSTQGVLASKEVVAVSAGENHRLALCSDGTVAAWGRNDDGQLGDNSVSLSSVPVAVNTSGVLAGRTVIAITAGQRFSLVLCSDGTLATWGRNSSGQLGNDSFAWSRVPVEVNSAGVLSGKRPIAIAAGGAHSLALCSDGTLVAWGLNRSGQLGNDVLQTSPAPVAVAVTGYSVLAGRNVVAIAAGTEDSLAVCSDGTLAAWGDNWSGQLGNGGTSDAAVPGAVNTSSIAAAERFSRVSAGDVHVLAIVAQPAVPVVTTLPAGPIAADGAVLRGTVYAGMSAVNVAFDYGETSAYGFALTGLPSPVPARSYSPVAASLVGLTPGTHYHFRARIAGAAGTFFGEDRTFRTYRNDPTLTGLTVSESTLTPAFASGTTAYTVSVPSTTTSIQLTPATADVAATVKINDVAVASGNLSHPIALVYGDNVVRTVVTAQDGTTTRTYTVVVTRPPPAEMNITFGTTGQVGLTLPEITLNGLSVSLVLNFAPIEAHDLTVINVTGPGFINGRFSNLDHGQAVALSHGGITNHFVANYYGGTGNDLVLQWADTRVMAWGGNSGGQLGDNSTTDRLAPVMVSPAGALAGKTVLAVQAGGSHTLALCADGTLAAWGANVYGQLGNNSTTASLVPVAVDASGVLAGKTVVAISAGSGHNLALCSDGTLAAWGSNSAGAIGTGNYTNSRIPVAVDASGVLAGRRVVAISAGREHSLAVCSDGTLTAWGSNAFRQLGIQAQGLTNVPVIVQVIGGAPVVTPAAGGNHTLALRPDGTLFAFGSNRFSYSGILAGRTITGLAAGMDHSLVLCSDGTVASWGSNAFGKLGNDSFAPIFVPQNITASSVLAGRRVTSVAAGFNHSLALCADGTVAAWGSNSSGQLGTDSNVVRLPPVPGLRSVHTGSQSDHSVALFAWPLIATMPASVLLPTGATLNGMISTQFDGATVSFDFGTSTTYGSSVTGGSSTSVPGATDRTVAASIGGLTPGRLYHFRFRVTTATGTIVGHDQTFQTPLFSDVRLASLTLSEGTLTPAFSSNVVSYSMSVPGTTNSVKVTPVTAHLTAIVRINGATVASGSASAPIDLTYGTNPIRAVVTAQDGITTETYTVVVHRAAPDPVTANFSARGDVGLSTNGFTAINKSVSIALNYAPSTGTDLMLIENIGTEFIVGAFNNLAWGQQVALTYEGVTYRFVANYFGGTGNDLVLQWANTRVMAGGSNNHGQLGDNSIISRSVPTAVLSTGVLSGKTVVEVAAGGSHSMALCSDGTLAAWGDNAYGQLGNNSTVDSPVPVAVLTGGTVVAISAGNYHSLALFSDGTVAAWGNNGSGALGNDSNVNSPVPVMVNTSGVLAARRVVMICAGRAHNLAVCSDGTVAAWGANEWGQLGNSSNFTSRVPVLVYNAGLLAGKTVVTAAVGGMHSVALCSDGTLAAWGSNNSGRLGTGLNVTNTIIPVSVMTSGVLSGRTVTAVSAGDAHTVVRCSDGTMAAWGANNYAQLGLGYVTKYHQSEPVRIALTGWTITAIDAGERHNLALDADGRMLTWGYPSGNNLVSDYRIPSEVGNASLAPGELFVRAGAGAGHSLMLVAASNEARADTGAATGASESEATLHGFINAAAGGDAAVSFEYGETTSYGSTIDGTPAHVPAGTTSYVSASLTGLIPNQTYHFRIRAVRVAGIQYGNDAVFTTLPDNDARLSSLTLSAVAFTPVFDSGNLQYTASVPEETASITVTPITARSGATARVNGLVVASGSASGPIALGYGANTLRIRVTAPDGVTDRIYTVVVFRNLSGSLPVTTTFSTAAEVGLTSDGVIATGGSVSIALNFAPPPGTRLTVVNNTSADFINGTFSNLDHGQAVNLIYEGIIYPFVANYFGGTGNDLVLQWANSRVMAWGYNLNGQLGDETLTNRRVAANVVSTGAMDGRTVLALAGGGLHSLALCSDGTVAVWGRNVEGQLGDDRLTDSRVPVVVHRDGVLSGRTVVALSGGAAHSLALCSDGTLAAWGDNSYGQLGTNNGAPSRVPVAVGVASPVGQDRIVAVSAGNVHSLALRADGTLAAWGQNAHGQLGRGDFTGTAVPTPVFMSGVLEGKLVVAVAAGAVHSLALCSDGTVTAWGDNDSGQLGDNSTIDRPVPVAVDVSGVLAGKTVVAIAAGYFHSVALCSDGTLAAWGRNTSGQLGDNSTTNRSVPVAVSLNALDPGTIVGVAAGANHSLARRSDGTIATWGVNNYGQLGNDTTSSSVIPTLVSMAPLAPGEWFGGVSSGSTSNHALALASLPVLPFAVTRAASSISMTGATLHGAVNAAESMTVAFDYGTETTYGSTVTGLPSPVPAGRTTAVSAALTGLTPGTRYHYRVRAAGANNVLTGDDLTFNTLTRLEDWRQTWFGATANTGDAADGFDFDSDRLPNLIEWACGLNPAVATELPVSVVRRGDVIEFTCPRSTAALADGLSFAVEWSDTMAEGSWSPEGVTEETVSDDGVVRTVKTTISAGGSGRRFLRLRVTTP